MPIPKDIIEDLGNFIAEDYHDRGEFDLEEKMHIVGQSCYSNHEKDDLALESIYKTLTMLEERPNIKEATIDGLQESYKIFQKGKPKPAESISINDALIIVSDWTQLEEFNDKLEAVGWILPESFLPYLKNDILRSIDKARGGRINRFTQRDKNAYYDKLASYLNNYAEESVAITKMHAIIQETINDTRLRDDVLRKLKDACSKWRKIHKIDSISEYLSTIE